jgi:hypothetical protein
MQKPGKIVKIKGTAGLIMIGETYILVELLKLVH